MKKISAVSLVAVLALGALPALAFAAEAPAASEPSREALQQKLDEAQKHLDAAVREVGDLSAQLGRQFNMNFRFNPGDGAPPRALLGVGVGYSGEKDGAHIFNVSPGGPAAEAGIKEGDIITSIGGEDLTKDSNPGRALVEKMRQIDPNLKVQVGVLRDGKKLNFDVMPRPAAQVFSWGGGPSGLAMPAVPAIPAVPGQPGARMFTMPMPPGGPGEVRSFTLHRGDEPGARFRGMEFATLSEQLGSYFGVKSGVLVVRAGVNSPFKLRDGDVILAIDGREATSAQHAGRILRSYQDGEKLTLRVQRDRKAQNIEVTVPSGRDDD